jgi:ribosomal subunit interface protein
MHIVVSGKQLDLGEALQTHVREKLSAGVTKYYEKALEAHVTFRPEAHMIHAEAAVKVGHDIDVHAAAEATEPYAAFDALLDKVEKQLRRDKRKRRNHHNGAA